MVLVKAFKLALRSWRMVFWLYGVNFLIGLLMLIPAYTTFRREAGSSRAFLKLLEGFDYTVYADFMHNSKSAMMPFLTIGFWFGVLYLFLSLFFSGGILLNLLPNRQQPFRVSWFLAASVQNFGRFFRLLLCVGGFIFLVALGGLCIGGLGAIILSEMVNEETMIYFLLACFSLVAMLFLLAVCVGDYAKILLFRQDRKRALAAFRQAIRFVLSNFCQTIGFYLLLVSMAGGCFAIYFLVASWLVTHGWTEIVLLFLIQQVFIFLRVFLKVWTLSVAMTVFSHQEPQQFIGTSNQ
ncbi:hypothetical protein GCM10027347_35560 [Larkinella harenae]